MKVILMERVKSLGNVGEIVNVSQGYARNFLIPRNWAVLADDSNKSVLEDQKRRLAKKIAEEKTEAQEACKLLNGLTLEFTKKVGANGKLFGTVTTNEITKALEEKGVSVERRQIIVTNPIKSVGEFELKAKLFDGIEADFKVKVEMSAKQAEEMKKKAQASSKNKNAEPKEEAKASTEEQTDTTEVETTEA